MKQYISTLHISTLRESLEYLIRNRERSTRQFGYPKVTRFIASSLFSASVKYTPLGAIDKYK